MSYAGTVNTSTWQGMADSQQLNGIGRRMIGRGMRLLADFSIPKSQAALGIVTPGESIQQHHHQVAIVLAFSSAAELAEEMVEANEMDSPDPAIWNEALMFTQQFGMRVSAPLVSPLQLGGISIEWHEKGIDLELRFRGAGDVFAAISDARRELPEFMGRANAVARARQALSVLAARLA